ncbi:hypothetical protein [Levilactobacillus enshiensis]|uniref:hypothetical protein n=1 Tax=Levilactobacillus enshiensis TaxID=2590213 RepID=UPI001CDCBD65|nr:hypothetical protein [Levilactobacillus enshiensis]
MKNVVKGIVAMGVGVSLLGGTLTASASSQYSASRSNSVRLVWRASMGRHALVASQGARYSEHLGIRYDYNSDTPDMVWYTNAHEELYDVDSGNYLIYYHVNSADGQHGGWIWRGYLKDASSVKKTKTSAPATTPSTSTDGNGSTDSNTSTDSTTPATTSTMDWTPYIQVDALEPADINLMKQFPNSFYSEQAAGAANDFLETGTGRDILDQGRTTELLHQEYSDFLAGWGLKTNSFQVILFNVSDPNSSSEVAQALTDAGYDTGVRDNQYKGWYVGGQIEPADAESETTPAGEGILFLVKE